MGFLNKDTRYKSSLPKSFPDEIFGSDYIGIEFECENVVNNLPSGAWVVKGDGSLRDGLEFTLGPVLGSSITKGIDLFFDNVAFDISPRTGLHIHLDMTQDEDTWQRVRNMFLGYYIFEEVFFNIAGQYRKTLGYSNPLELSTNILRAVVQSNNPRSLEYIMSLSKYNAYNTKSLSTHGTVEFRHMPMVKTREEAINWIKFLLAFKKEIYALGEEANILDVLIDKSSCDAFINRVLSATNYTLSGVYDFSQCVSRLASIDSITGNTEQTTQEDPRVRPSQAEVWPPTATGDISYANYERVLNTLRSYSISSPEVASLSNNDIGTQEYISWSTVTPTPDRGR